MNERGVALIIVILIISVIVALTLQFNIATRSEIDEAANLSDTIKLLSIAKSGFHGGEGLLMEDDNNYDTLTEDWAKSGLISQMSGSFFSDGAFDLAIKDEAGKIPLNKLVDGTAYNEVIRELLTRFLSQPEFNLDEQDLHDIVDAIKDWIDADNETTGFGAENAYYQGLEVPYSCKNGPLSSIDELLMVKGMTKEIYYGTEEKPGMQHYVTIHGDGKINLNTAPPLVLRALDNEITDDMVEDMDEYRKDENNDLSGQSWYKDVTGMANISIEPDLITTKSNTFTITATGYFGNMKTLIIGVVERNSQTKTVKVLSWKVN